MRNDTKKGKVTIHVPTGSSKVLEKVVNTFSANPEINTLWEIVNTNATDRLGMTDHGPVHFQIVSNIALRLSRILKKAGVKLSIEENYNIPYEYGEIVIFLTSIMHDLGMSIEREGHEGYSLFLANNLLRENLDFIPTRERTILISETLHAIISHRSGGRPLSVEAGIVRVADALDMSEGRSRIPYEQGKVDIHSISAAAIDKVEILEGDKRPIHINIVMNNSAGVFQLDELLKRKIKGSGIETYISVRATVQGNTEKKLLKEFSL